MEHQKILDLFFDGKEADKDTTKGVIRNIGKKLTTDGLSYPHSSSKPRFSTSVR